MRLVHKTGLSLDEASCFLRTTPCPYPTARPFSVPDRLRQRKHLMGDSVPPSQPVFLVAETTSVTTPTPVDQPFLLHHENIIIA
jgi:hypothetical protein